jgi:hypothetical protein
MERDYENGEILSNVAFFTGMEVEKTPAYGMKTLFVVGVYPAEDIGLRAKAMGCSHIYLGANQSFDPGNWQNGGSPETDAWDAMIKGVLELGYLTTLDFDVRHVEWVCEGGYAENNMFIPQISVKIPYLSLLGYNTTLKIDDKGYNATNPGVWCHSLHDLMDRKKFTPWSKYKEDKPI